MNTLRYGAVALALVLALLSIISRHVDARVWLLSVGSG
jgi:hypothetical protein